MQGVFNVCRCDGSKPGGTARGRLNVGVVLYLNFQTVLKILQAPGEPFRKCRAGKMRAKKPGRSCRPAGGIPACFCISVNPVNNQRLETGPRAASDRIAAPVFRVSHSLLLGPAVTMALMQLNFRISQIFLVFNFSLCYSLIEISCYT